MQIYAIYITVSLLSGISCLMLTQQQAYYSENNEKLHRIFNKIAGCFIQTHLKIVFFIYMRTQ